MIGGISTLHAVLTTVVRMRSAAPRPVPKAFWIRSGNPTQKRKPDDGITARRNDWAGTWESTHFKRFTGAHGSMRTNLAAAVRLKGLQSSSIRWERTPLLV